MAKTPKVSSRVSVPALKQPTFPTSNGDVYVNLSCSEELRDAATSWAEDNGLKYAQDTFRVAATKFLKSAGYLPK